MALRYQVDARAKRARFGEQPRVDLPVGADERAQRQLVEHDVHDRHRRLPRACDAPPPRPGARARARARRPGTGTARAAARPPSTLTNERTPATRAYSAAAPAPTSSATGIASADPPSRSPTGGSTKRRDEQRDEHEHRPPAVAAQRPHDQRADQRRHERVAEREHQDVAGRAPARDEELRVVLRAGRTAAARTRAPTGRRGAAPRARSRSGARLRRASASRIPPLFARP